MDIAISSILLSLLAISVFSITNFAKGAFFREQWYIGHEICLIVIGSFGIFMSKLYLICLAAPFLSHIYWVYFSKKFIKGYKITEDAYFIIDLPINLLSLILSIIY